MSLFKTTTFRIAVAVSLLAPVFLSSCAAPSTRPVAGRTQTLNDFSQTQGDTHMVRKGETLWRISKIYDVPVDILKGVNRISGDAIKIGDQLLIPMVIGAGQIAVGAGQSALGAARAAPQIFIPSPVGPGRFMWPVRGSIMTRFDVVRDGVHTKGIDISTQMKEPILASRAGRVSFVSESVKGYGKMIIVDHSQAYQTVYAYNETNLVRKGQRVRQGDVIAKAGVSTRTRQPALHFEIRRHHQPLNPEPLLG